jgi:hypothetical protein
MSEPKPLASLSPTLLARKGAAKPAMRRQVHYPDSLARMASEDDLGWNDMGDEQPEAASAAEQFPEATYESEYEPISDAGDEQHENAGGEVVPIKARAELPVEPSKPMVLYHREEIARQVIAPAVVHVPVNLPDPAATHEFVQAPAYEPAKPRRSALENGRRAAFTLRMDGERHLKLRLACTIRNRSAQQLMTEALDKLIAELPDLAALAAQVAERR